MTGTKFQIKRKSMRDEAYNILQDWIISGVFEPKRKLKDNELSEMLGISRTPVREALLRLEDEGLIETKANQWTMVSPISIEQAEHIYPMVEVLENLAIEQGVENIGDSEIFELEKINERFKEELNKGKKEEAFQSDMKFHDVLIKLSRNEELSKVLKSLKLKIKRIEVYYFETQENKLDSYYEHLNIIESLKAKSINGIKNEISNNWRKSLERIKLKVNME